MDTESKLMQIFKKVGIDFEKNIYLKDENVFGSKIRLSARDLLIVFFWIESVFKIRIPEELIVNGDFDTYEKILNTVEKCQGKKSL
ncbi:peptide maturation system acyl carrier-related protein [Bariatricus sp. SGI.154]|uniref:peptide maturation system acyl carrier-related protein n=1 Tax=Bariatricus sp. SGI.154 TaxID=3420549 RepID=UPI003D040E60